MLSHLPTVCVVIPALNEAEWIRTCLHSLAAVRYPPSLWEVIVADNGSTDATVELAQSFVLKLNLRVLQLPGVSVAALRNIAAGYTTAERLSFLDADCEVPPNWLEASAQAANVDPNAVLGAPYLVRPDAGWVATVWQHHEERAQDGSVSYVSTHNLHVSRQLFEELNGFDVSLESNEDYEFCQRALAAGHPVEQRVSLAVVHHGSPQGLRNFYARERWHGKHIVTVFLADVSKRRNWRALLIAVHALCSMTLTIVGLGVSAATGHWRVAATAAALWISAPIALSFVSTYRSRHWRDFLQLSVLFFVYGVARSLCILDRRAPSPRKASKVATA